MQLIQNYIQNLFDNILKNSHRPGAVKHPAAVHYHLDSWPAAPNGLVEYKYKYIHTYTKYNPVTPTIKSLAISTLCCLNCGGERWCFLFRMSHGLSPGMEQCFMNLQWNCVHIYLHFFFFFLGIENLLRSGRKCVGMLGMFVSTIFQLVIVPHFN